MFCYETRETFDNKKNGTVTKPYTFSHNLLLLCASSLTFLSSW